MSNSMRNLSETEQSIREVAQRIRTLREDMGISFETMASKTGLSVEEYKKNMFRMLKDMK